MKIRATDSNKQQHQIYFEEITSDGEVSEPRLSVGLYPKIGRCGFLTAPDPTKNLLKNPRHPCNP